MVKLSSSSLISPVFIEAGANAAVNSISKRAGPLASAAVYLIVPMGLGSLPGFEIPKAEVEPSLAKPNWMSGLLKPKPSRVAEVNAKAIRSLSVASANDTLMLTDSIF